MKQIDNITALRSTLERFYSGETSRDEELALERWFASHSDADIPHDLRADAMMFRSISEARTEAFANKIISSLEKRRRPAIAAWITSIVASAAACLTLVFSLSGGKESSVAPGNAIVAAVTTPEHDTKSHSLEAAADPQPSAIEPRTTKASQPKRHSRSRQNQIVVTDSAEARRHIDKALRLLTDNISTGSRQVRKAGNDLRTTSEIIKNTLYEENS